MSQMKRASFTLPPEVLDQLAYVSSRLGVSKSSIVGDVLAQSLGPLSELMRALPEGAEADAGEAVRRLRGASGDVIRERLNTLRDVMAQIDPDSFHLEQYDDCEDRPAGCSCDYSSGERIAPPGGCLVHGHQGA